MSASHFLTTFKQVMKTPPFSSPSGVTGEIAPSTEDATKAETLGLLFVLLPKLENCRGQAVSSFHTFLRGLVLTSLAEHHQVPDNKTHLSLTMVGFAVKNPPLGLEATELPMKTRCSWGSQTSHTTALPVSGRWVTAHALLCSHRQHRLQPRGHPGSQR